MATVTTSIGTSSRDYSTVTAWEADLDDTGVYSSGDDAVGEGYDDSEFDEAVTFDGGTTVGLDSFHLTVASGERHDGTAGTGCRNIYSGSTTTVFGVTFDDATMSATVSWWEIATDSSNTNQIDDLLWIEPVNSSVYHTSHHNIVHRTYGSGWKTGIYHSSSSGGFACFGNIVYDVQKTTGSGSADVEGLIDSFENKNGKLCYIYNNTVFNTTNDGGGSGDCHGMTFSRDDDDFYVKNNIVVGTNSDGSGTVKDFQEPGHSDWDADYNLSSDTTAPGGNSLTSKAASDQFVSISAGSEDLHLKAGADAIDEGQDLGTTPSGVEIDIDGRDRDAEGDTWDMGADEYVVTVQTASPDTLNVAVTLPTPTGKAGQVVIPDTLNVAIDIPAPDASLVGGDIGAAAGAPGAALADHRKAPIPTVIRVVVEEGKTVRAQARISWRIVAEATARIVRPARAQPRPVFRITRARVVHPVARSAVVMGMVRFRAYAVSRIDTDESDALIVLGEEGLIDG